jgi:hypothetical protein
MNELFKEKVGYALALLAALFTLTPVLEKIGKYSFVFLNVPITITSGYFILCVLLGLAVYFFALSFVSYRFFFISIIIGNLFYLIAIVIPPIYLILYLTSILLQKFSINIKVALGIFVGGLIGIILSRISFYYEKKTIKRDSPFIIKHLQAEQDKNLLDANSMLDKHQYRSVVISCWRALEISLKKLLITQGVYHIYPSITNLAGLGYKNKMISESLFSWLVEFYKQIEKVIVRSGESIDHIKASKIFDETRLLLKEIDSLTERNSDISEKLAK